MKVDELRSALEHLAGPPQPAPPSGVRDVHRTARKQRAVRAGVVCCVVVVLAVVGALFVSHERTTSVAPADTTPSTTESARNESIGSGIDGAPTPEQAQRLAEQKLEYDPAELEYLIAQATSEPHGSVPDDQNLVGTLEFRRACRVTLRLAVDTATDDPDLRASTVDQIMDAQRQRLADREPTGDQSVQMFGELADRINAGDGYGVVGWLNGTCPDALRWTQSP
jgi:hypothetical protein